MKLEKSIKHQWRRWLEKQDRLTQKDIKFRDAFFRKICLWCYQKGVTANRTTLLGFLLTIFWVVSYEMLSWHSFWLQVIFLVLIGFTDTIDGPLARVNDDVTPEGTLGDHFRDIIYQLYAARIALDFHLPIYIFAAIILVEVWALYFKGRALHLYTKGIYSWETFLEFAGDNFQHTFRERMQSTNLAFGLPFFMFGASANIAAFLVIGIVLILNSLRLGVINSWYKESKWKP